MTHIISQEDLSFNSATKRYTLTFHKPLKITNLVFKQFYYRVASATHPNCVIVNSDLRQYLNSNHLQTSQNTGQHSSAILLLEEKDSSGKYRLRSPATFVCDNQKPISELSFWYTAPSGEILSQATSNAVSQTTSEEKNKCWQSPI